MLSDSYSYYFKNDDSKSKLYYDTHLDRIKKVLNRVY